MSYCLVPRDLPTEVPCPTCGCFAGSHIQVAEEGGIVRFMCVACDAPEIDLDPRKP